MAKGSNWVAGVEGQTARRVQNLVGTEMDGVFSDVPARYEAMSLRQAYDHVLERRTIADPRKDRVLHGDVRVRWQAHAIHVDGSLRSPS